MVESPYATTPSPDTMSPIVNARPAVERGWTSPNPTEPSVMTVMYRASKGVQPSMSTYPVVPMPARTARRPTSRTRRWWAFTPTRRSSPR